MRAGVRGVLTKQRLRRYVSVFVGHGEFGVRVNGEVAILKCGGDVFANATLNEEHRLHFFAFNAAKLGGFTAVFWVILTHNVLL
jgi:hypothetical protein